MGAIISRSGSSSVNAYQNWEETGQTNRSCKAVPNINSSIDISDGAQIASSGAETTTGFFSSLFSIQPDQNDATELPGNTELNPETHSPNIYQRFRWKIIGSKARKSLGNDIGNMFPGVATKRKFTLRQKINWKMIGSDARKAFNNDIGQMYPKSEKKKKASWVIRHRYKKPADKVFTMASDRRSAHVSNPPWKFW